MHLDFLTLACLKDDLSPLVGARVQGLVFPDENVVAMELYAGRRVTLWLDGSQQHARALLQLEKARRGTERDTPLALLLRKYVRDGRLRGVHQPAWERVLHLDFESAEGRTTLVAEIMGRYSNLLLLDEAGTILECVRRAGPEQNARRVTLPQHPYVPPPPILKRPPTSVSVMEWSALLAAAPPDMPLERLLLRDVAAVSPTLAREVAMRATGNTAATVEETSAEALHEAVGELFAPLRTGVWEPHVARDEDGEVVAFAPYRLTQSEESEPIGTISEGIAAFFAARLNADAYAAARRRVGETLAEARKEVESRLYGLRQQAVEPAEVERLREAGELLLAYQWQVPRGADVVELTDYEGEPRRIALDPTLTPVENAQRLFTRYDKRKRAAEEIPPRLEQAEQDLLFLDSLAGDLALAEERPEIDAVREALVAAGFAQKRVRGSAGALVRGPRHLLVEGWTVMVGRNARQNDELTFRVAAPDDLWFHARGVPGSHVILRCAGRNVPDSVLHAAAALAAFYSQVRGSTEADVTMTERRHVHRVSGSRPGLVTVRHEQTLHVRPRGGEEVEIGD